MAKNFNIVPLSLFYNCVHPILWLRALIIVYFIEIMNEKSSYFHHKSWIVTLDEELGNFRYLSYSFYFRDCSNWVPDTFSKSWTIGRTSLQLLCYSSTLDKSPIMYFLLSKLMTRKEKKRWKWQFMLP